MHRLIASGAAIAMIGSARADASGDLLAQMSAAAGGAAWVGVQAPEWSGTERSSGPEGRSPDADPARLNATLMPLARHRSAL